MKYIDGVYYYKIAREKEVKPISGLWGLAILALIFISGLTF